MLFSPHGGIHDYGQTKRIVPPAMRLALIARDKGCTLPGCDRPPAYTEAHHIDEYVAQKGPTSLTNCLLVCAWHHREFGRRGWHPSHDQQESPTGCHPPGSTPPKHPAETKPTTHHYDSDGPAECLPPARVGRRKKNANKMINGTSRASDSAPGTQESSCVRLRMPAAPSATMPRMGKASSSATVSNGPVGMTVARGLLRQRCNGDCLRLSEALGGRRPNGRSKIGTVIA